jgi:hypothetical protein
MITTPFTPDHTIFWALFLFSFYSPLHPPPTSSRRAGQNLIIVTLTAAAAGWIVSIFSLAFFSFHSRGQTSPARLVATVYGPSSRLHGSFDFVWSGIPLGGLRFVPSAWIDWGPSASLFFGGEYGCLFL